MVGAAAGGQSDAARELAERGRDDLRIIVGGGDEDDVRDLDGMQLVALAQQDALRGRTCGVDRRGRSVRCRMRPRLGRDGVG